MSRCPSEKTDPLWTTVRITRETRQKLAILGHIQNQQIGEVVEEACKLYVDTWRDRRIQALEKELDSLRIALDGSKVSLTACSPQSGRGVILNGLKSEALQDEGLALG